MTHNIRNVVEKDFAFIFSSWLKSYKNSQPHIDSSIYFKGQHNLIRIILSQSDTLVLSLNDDPDSIIGYVVYSDITLHWIYIKSVYRNMGFANILLDNAFTNKKIQCYTHFTPAKHFLLEDDVRFNPYYYLEALCK